MPPNVTGITADQDRAYVDLQRDAEAFRCIGEAGWVLVRRSELQGIIDTLADVIRTTSESNALHQSETVTK